MTVDLRNHTNPHFNDFPTKCTHTHSITPMQAAALIALCLSRHHKRFTLTALSEDADGGMQIISVPKTATVETLIEKFKEVNFNHKKSFAITLKLVCRLKWANTPRSVLPSFGPRKGRETWMRLFWSPPA